MGIEEKIFKIAQSLYYELYTPFMKDPDELLDAGEVQMDLFPALALRKFQLWLKHTREGEETDYPEYLAFGFISTTYERLGQDKRSLEARKKYWELLQENQKEFHKSDIHELIRDLESPLLEDDNSFAFSLIEDACGNFKNFWDNIISDPQRFDYYEKLKLKELLQRYTKQNPEEASSILSRIQTDFEEISPDSKAFGPYDLRKFVAWRDMKPEERSALPNSPFDYYNIKKDNYPYVYYDIKNSTYVVRRD